MRPPARGILVRELAEPKATDFAAISRLAVESLPADSPSPLLLGSVSLQADSLLDSDRTLPPRCFRRWWVAEENGAPVGFAFARQFPQIYDPGKMHIGIFVRPEARGRGVAHTLLQSMAASLERLELTSIWMLVREPDQAAVDWAARRGFVRDQRTWESALDPRGFSLDSLPGLLTKLSASGIAIRTLAELKREDASRWAERIYELDCQVTRDAPLSSGFTPPGMPVFIDQRVLNPAVIADGFHVAIAHGQYVGYSCQFASPSPRIWHTGMTGVARAYRRQGVATAMKFLGIQCAQKHGVERVMTSNDASNHGMLALNLKLGFRIHTGWVEMRKIVLPGQALL